MKNKIWSVILSGFLAAAPLAATADTPPAQSAAAPNQAELSADEQQQLERALLVLINPYNITQAKRDAIITLSQTYRTRVPAHKRDESILDWADILVNAGEDWQQTVLAYRKLFAKLPKQELLRFQLAQALFYNGEPDAAQREFEKFRATPDLTENHEKSADSWISLIQNRQKWQFGMNFRFLNDSNINQAPRSTVYYRLPGGGTFSNPETAQRGLGYHLGATAQKRWHLPWRHNAVRFNAGADWDYYWNAKKYNQFGLNFGVGWLYETPRYHVEVQPFTRHVWNARGEGRREEGRLAKYSNEFGTRFRVWQWLSPKFQYDVLYQPSYVKYDNPLVARTQNASRHFLNASLTYQQNDKQNWQLGAYFSKTNAKDDTNSSRTVGANVGWRQEWPKSFYSDLTLGVARFQNDKPYWFGLQRKNKIYSVNAQFFNPTWQYKGFMPRLVLNYQKTKSNLPTQSYDSRDAYITIQKSF